MLSISNNMTIYYIIYTIDYKYYFTIVLIVHGNNRFSIKYYRYILGYIYSKHIGKKVQKQKILNIPKWNPFKCV